MKTTTSNTDGGSKESGSPAAGVVAAPPAPPALGAMEPGATGSTAEDPPERTMQPSDLRHATILMKRNLRTDLSRKRLFLARMFLPCAMLILWTVGFFFNYPEQDRTDAEKGGFKIHPAESFKFPERILLGGAGFVDLLALEDRLKAWVPMVEIVVGTANSSDFESLCEYRIKGSKDTLGAFVDNPSSFGLYYEETQDRLSPSRQILAGAQRALNSVLLNMSSVPHYNISWIQHVPEKIAEDQGATERPAPVVSVILPGIFLSMSVAIMMMFLLGPMVNEKLQGVTQSLILVGVKRHVYMLQWAAYYSISGLVTAAVLTVLSFGWKMYPMSNASLVFLSHFLAMVQTSVLSAFVAQIVNQEELASGLPWIFAFSSMAVAVPFLILDVATGALAAFSVISPFVGMIAYSAIYARYDVWGYSVGVHPSLNVSSSGLLAVTLAQVAGIIFWVCAIFTFCKLQFSARSKRNMPSSTYNDAGLQGDNFEPLSPNSQVVVSIRNLSRSFVSGCIKKSKPVEVLRGLSMDICRGEVFGFLGHNGAGKTTTIRVLSGEIGMDYGEVTYNFASGSMRLSEGDMDEIRTRIGVCPQHNVIIGDLTCRETLLLFASLKGRTAMKPGQRRDDAISDEVNRLLAALKFTEEDADKPVKSFSGGMQRRVSLAIALLGNPELVLLDEPTAGCDPYTRRQIWDLIIDAKRNRSIVLTTHFLDEADILSDRIGIISKGELMTCGSTLFLKHHYGIGYSLSYSGTSPVDLNCMVTEAKDVSAEKQGEEEFCWELPYGTEQSFPVILHALNVAGATNVSLNITTLEEVFLATEEEAATSSIENGPAPSESPPEAFDNEEASSNSSDDCDVEGALSEVDLQRRIWEPQGEIRRISFFKRLGLVQHFMMGNAWKTKGAVSLNVVMPIIYLIACLVVVRVVGAPQTGSSVLPNDIFISPYLLGSDQSSFFGLPTIPVTIAPIIPADQPADIEDMFDNALPTSGGYWASNSTLQYNATFSQFALQVGEALLANYSLWLHNNTDMEGAGVSARLVPIQYEPTQFRLDLLLVPLGLTFGFVGMVYSVLDVLLLKSNNIFGLFRTTGISDWIVNIGVCCYKCTTTFLPFFVLVVALGVGLESVAFGSAGRWLGTVLLLLLYAFSVTPIGLLIGTSLSDYKSVSNWFPGVYMTFVSMPYSAWSICLQLFPQSRDLILVIGDILCIIPPFAFQRGIGAVIEISTAFDDPSLSWKTVWSFDSRIWYVLLVMLTVGLLEWYWLRVRTLHRPRMTKLSDDETNAAEPVAMSANDNAEERDRSLADDRGIKARELVKVFRIKQKRGRGGLKKAVAGVSFGVNEGEIYTLVGPNGAGKSVTMSAFSGEHSPEHGVVCLDGECAGCQDNSISHLFAKSSVSMVPQFDALFPNKTCKEHLAFYAKVRGLDLAAASTKDHIEAIVKVLGLADHLGKESEALSGGFKRRLSLAIALVGYPRCILLDEVTTGMSPDARHRVWEVLKSKPAMRQAMPAILLSTHYMDEASTLGTRIGIMVDGALVATGALSSLQEQYCHSYFVEVALEHDAPESAQDEILATFSENGMSAEYYEIYPYRFKMKVPFNGDGNRTAQLASIFSLLETNKSALSIHFYSVAHMNLEQIFIDLCRKQLEADEDWGENARNESEEGRTNLS